MNQKLTLVMLLMVLALAGTAIYFSRRPAPQPHHPSRLVFQPTPGAISEFSFKSAHGQRLAFTRHGAHWWITSPIHAWATDYQVEDLLTTLKQLSWPYHVPVASQGPYSPPDAGLAPPRAVLTLHDENGKTYTLDIGRRNAQGRLLVRPSGAEHGYIDTVDSAWLKRLQRSPEAFRSHDLTRFHTHAVANIEIRSPAGMLRLRRHHHGWLLTKPYLAPANNGKVNQWLSNVQMLSAHAFASESAKSAGLQNGPLTITISFQAPHPPAAKTTAKSVNKAAASRPVAPEPLVLRFGRYTDLTDQFLYATSSENPALAVIGVDTFKPLNKSFTALRDRRLTRAKVRQATEVVLRRRGSNAAAVPAALYLLHRLPAPVKPAPGQASPGPGANQDGRVQWYMGTSDKDFHGAPLVVISAAKVRQLLKRVGKLKAKKFLPPTTDLPQLGLQPARRSLEFHIPGRIHALTIAFGAPQKDGLTPAKMPSWPGIYLLPTPAVDKLFPAAATLRPPSATTRPKAGK